MSNRNYIYIVRLDGGLGNQMFQYAFARSLVHSYGGRIVFDESAYRNGKFHNSLVNFMLAPNLVFFSEHSISILFSKIKAKVFRRLKFFSQDNYERMVRWGIYAQCRTDYFNAAIPPVRRVNYITGNWLSHKFNGNIRDILVSDFKITRQPSESNAIMLNKILSSNSVCLHIRRGDYCSSQWSSKLLVCDYNYYNRAIEYVKSMVKDPVFFVFSNNHEDIEWIRNNYTFSAQLVYVDLSNVDYEELRLMIACRHFILSNSTFSYWAQYLSSNPNKIVVSPKSWNNGVWNVDDIIMDDWHLIENIPID